MSCGALGWVSSSRSCLIGSRNKRIPGKRKQTVQKYSSPWPSCNHSYILPYLCHTCRGHRQRSLRCLRPAAPGPTGTRSVCKLTRGPIARRSGLWRWGLPAARAPEAARGAADVRRRPSSGRGTATKPRGPPIGSERAEHLQQVPEGHAKQSALSISSQKRG